MTTVLWKKGHFRTELSRLLALVRHRRQHPTLPLLLVLAAAERPGRPRHTHLFNRRERALIRLQRFGGKSLGRSLAHGGEDRWIFFVGLLEVGDREGFDCVGDAFGSEFK